MKRISSDEFAAGAFLLMLAVYGCVLLVRRSRFRSLARTLGAGRVETGWFSPWRITGDGFAVGLRKAGKRLLTSVEVPAPGAPGTWIVRSGFFAKHPDWSCAFVPGVRRERVFITEVSISGWVAPTPEAREELLGFWNRRPRDPAAVHRALESLRIREFTIRDGVVSADLPGVVLDRARLRRTVEALRLLV